MKKILFVASIPEHFRAFHLPYLKWFKDNNYEVHIACNGHLDLPNVDYQWQIDIERSPINFKNISAYKQLKELFIEHQFALIHCHTPMASFLTRLVNRNSQLKNTKILYTAHGFHFYKGAPTLNWLIYYPIEKYLSRYTDGIVTINNEDYNLIKNKWNTIKSNYYLIDGIGVDNTRFNSIDYNLKNSLRIEKGFSENKLILIYAAEFISRKNHQFIIDAVYNNQEIFSNVEILFAGKGILEEVLIKEIKDKNLTQKIKLIGFRKDMDEVYKASDLLLSTSLQEGLPINIIEGMFTGLPIIASNVRGHADLVKHGENGFLFELNNTKSFCEYVSMFIKNPILLTEMGQQSMFLSEKYKIENTVEQMEKIYKNYL